MYSWLWRVSFWAIDNDSWVLVLMWSKTDHVQTKWNVYPWKCLPALLSCHLTAGTWRKNTQPHLPGNCRSGRPNAVTGTFILVDFIKVFDLHYLTTVPNKTYKQGLPTTWPYGTLVSKINVFRQWSTRASISTCQHFTCKCAPRRQDGPFVLGNPDKRRFFRHSSLVNTWMTAVWGLQCTTPHLNTIYDMELWTGYSLTWTEKSTATKCHKTLSCKS